MPARRRGSRRRSRPRVAVVDPASLREFLGRRRRTLGDPEDGEVWQYLANRHIGAHGAPLSPGSETLCDGPGVGPQGSSVLEAKPCIVRGRSTRRPGAELFTGILGPRQPADFGELGHQPFVHFEQVLDIDGGVRALAVGQRTTQPVGQPVALGRRDPDLPLQQRDQRRRAVAHETSGQLRVEHLRRDGPDRVGQHVEVLLGSVDHTQRLGGEQRLERTHIDRERIDQCQFLAVPGAPRDLDEGQFREVGPLAMELGVEGVAGLRPECLDEIVEVDLSVDPAVADLRVRHRRHRARRR